MSVHEHKVGPVHKVVHIAVEVDRIAVAVHIVVDHKAVVVADPIDSAAVHMVLGLVVVHTVAAGHMVIEEGKEIEVVVLVEEVVVCCSLTGLVGRARSVYAEDLEIAGMENVVVEVEMLGAAAVARMDWEPGQDRPDSQRVHPSQRQS